MQMTNAEILREFKTAKRPASHVKVLAELNECSVRKICEILMAQGVDHRQLPRLKKPKPVTTPPAEDTPMPVDVVQNDVPTCTTMCQTAPMEEHDAVPDTPDQPIAPDGDTLVSAYQMVLDDLAEQIRLQGDECRALRAQLCVAEDVLANLAATHDTIRKTIDILK